MEEYNKIEELVRQDEMNKKAKERRKHIEPLFIESKQDFLTSTGSYFVPKHIVSAFGFITNNKNEYFS